MNSAASAKVGQNYLGVDNQRNGDSKTKRFESIKTADQQAAAMVLKSRAL